MPGSSCSADVPFTPAGWRVGGVGLIGGDDDAAHSAKWLTGLGAEGRTGCRGVAGRVGWGRVSVRRFPRDWRAVPGITVATARATSAGTKRMNGLEQFGQVGRNLPGFKLRGLNGILQYG